MDTITITSEVISKAIVVPVMCVFITIWLYIIYKWNIESLNIRIKHQDQNENNSIE
jgi:hypothetical protein